MSSTILVVDDQERLRKFVRAVLAKRGYAVLQASDGCEAREIAARNTVDLLITDLVMPGMSGVELIEQLYACGHITRHLIISGFAAPHAVSASGARGAFLTKPFSPEDLVRTVESLLRKVLTEMSSSELSLLEHDPAVIFRLDSDFRVTYCNAAWDRFARDNGGRGFTRAEVQGRYLFDMISGDVKTKYQAAFESSLRTGNRWQQEYECSSAAAFRRFMMFLYPGKETPGLLVVNSLLVETPHDRVAHPALETEYQSASGLVVMCCNCRRTLRVSADDAWDWVPEYVAHPPNLVSHGLCGPCNAQYGL